MAKYIVIGKKRENAKEGEPEFDPIDLVSTVGLAKGKTFTWDPGSEVTEKQVTDEVAKQLVEAGELKVVEAPASWADKPAA